MAKKRDYAGREHEPCRACGKRVLQHKGEAASHYFDRHYCSMQCLNRWRVRSGAVFACVTDIWPPKIPEHEDFGAGFGVHDVPVKRFVTKLVPPDSVARSSVGCSAAWSVGGGDA